MDGWEQQENSEEGQQQHGLRGLPIGCRGRRGFGVTPGLGPDPRIRDCQELGGVLGLQSYGKGFRMTSSPSGELESQTGN